MKEDGEQSHKLPPPGGIVVVLERDEVLKSIAERMIADELSKLVLKILVLDKMAEESELTEQDIVELDKRIKEGIRSRIEAKISA